MAKFLIEHKADINLADNYGRTALHIAAAVDYAEMVTYLIDSGGKFTLIQINFKMKAKDFLANV